MIRFLLASFGLILVMNTSCTSKNILMEPLGERYSEVSDLNPVFKYNPDYQHTIRKYDKVSISVWGQ